MLFKKLARYHSLHETESNKEHFLPALSLDVNEGPSLIDRISLVSLLMINNGLLVMPSSAHISSTGSRFDNTIGSRNPCTCSCSTDMGVNDDKYRMIKNGAK